MWDLAIVLIAAAALGVAYHRWRWRGPAILAAAGISANLAVGTAQWWRPHVEVAAIASRAQDWACHSTNLTPAILLLAVIPTLVLRFNHERVVTRHGQAGVAMLAAAVTVPVAIVVTLYWVIQFLGCDAL